MGLAEPICVVGSTPTGRPRNVRSGSGIGIDFLRAGRDRPTSRRAAENRGELAAMHMPLEICYLREDYHMQTIKSGIWLLQLV